MELTQYVTFEERGLAESENPALRQARFADLVRRRSRFVFQVAYAMLRNAQDAEDAVQETFWKLYRTGAWENMRDERAFLGRAAWRAALDRLPNRQSQSLPTEIPASAGTPEEVLITADWYATVHRLIEALPEELRQPLALSAVEEWNSREIGQFMGLSEGTVRTRLLRARQILKQKLAALMEDRHAK